MEPLELIEARFIDGLCQRYGQPPSVIRQEPAYDLMQMHSILILAEPEPEVETDG